MQSQTLLTGYYCVGWQRGLFLSGDFRVHNEAASLDGTSHPAGFSEADLTMTVHNGQSAPLHLLSASKTNARH